MAARDVMYPNKQKKNAPIPLWVGFVIFGCMMAIYFLRGLDLQLFRTTLVQPFPELEMKKMKTKGCVADGLLTGYGGDLASKIQELKRSQCEYVHRSVETWNNPPNFNIIAEGMRRVRSETGRNFLFGFFIAEAIDTTSIYYFPDEQRNFRFDQMCAPGTEGAWGANTCRPSLNQPEYRKYVRYITRKAMDLGFRDFTFGQIYYQDPNWKKRPVADDVIREMKDYAASKSIAIAVGAQTNDIDVESYLRNFDYITGGVGQHADGTIDEGPCNEAFWESSRGSFCWAMMWHERFKSKANNVLVYLDWNARANDDINRFVRMEPKTRRAFLAKAYRFFLTQNIGFLMPYLEVLDKSGRGCYGPNPEFYSPSERYSCRDEDAINDAFALNVPLANYSNQLNAEFVSQQVPATMIQGRPYQITLVMRNASMKSWSDASQIRLGSFGPQDNTTWGFSRLDIGDAEIGPGEEKTFSFNVTAPRSPGAYNFQWQMLQEGKVWFGQPSGPVLVSVMEDPNPPSHAIDGPACVNRQLVKCNKWCTQSGAWCNATTGQSSCTGQWYDDKGYAKPVECCVDKDCLGNQTCVENKCVTK